MYTGTNSMETIYQRKVSPVEKLFMILADIDPPFCNQIVVEGTGALDASLWQKAVAAACDANPGSRLAYKGRWAWARWVDSGVASPVRIIDGSGWNGYDSDGAPFLFEPLPFKTGHTCEVLLVNGSPPRLVFRSLHATMDGGGTLIWALDAFRWLRKEPLVGTRSTINDKDLVASLSLAPQAIQKREKCLMPTGLPVGETPGFAWKRTTLEGKFSKLLPQLALAIAREARKNGPGKVLIAVPLDLRRRVPGTASTANLTRRIFLDIPPEATIDEIQAQMQDKLDNLGSDPWLSTLYSYAPMALLRRLFRSSRDKDRQRGFYRDSGTISNLGKLPIELLQGGGFEARTCFFVPPEMEIKPFFITLTGCGNAVEMITAMPNVLANNGRLDQFIANVIAELKPKGV